VVYEETQSIAPGSNGEFSVIVGAGTRVDSTGNTADRIFASSGTVNCKDSSTASMPSFTTRSLHIKVGSIDLSPDVTIGNIPMAINSQKLADKGPSDFLQVSGTATQATLETVLARSTEITSLLNNVAGNTLNANTATTATTAITANSANTAVTANSFTGSLTGDVSGTMSATSVTKVRGVSISATAPSSGQVLKYDGTSWAPAADDSGTAGVTSVSANSPLSVSGSTSSPIISLSNVGTPGTYTKVTVDSFGRVTTGIATLTAADIPSLDFSKITSGLPASLSGYGITDAVKNAGSAPSIQSGTDASKPASGTAGRIYISSDTKQIYRDNGSTWDLIASASGSGGTIAAVLPGVGLTGGGSSGSVTLNVNVGTTANQIVQLDGSSKLPPVDGSALTNINPANFSAIVPVAKGGTGQTTATLGFNALSPATTKGDLITRDGSNNIRLPAGSDGQVLTTDSAQTSGLRWSTPPMGTVTNVTATPPLNVVAGTSTPAISLNSGSAVGQALRWNGSTWSTTKLNYTDLINSTAANPWPSTTCSAGQAVTWSSVSDSFICSLITITGSNFTTQSAGMVFAGPTTGGALPVFRGLVPTDLPAGGANGVYLNGGNSFGVPATIGTNDSYGLNLRANGADRITINPAGNVGIGITSPSIPLVVGGSGPSLTDGHFAVQDTSNSISTVTAKAYISGRDNAFNPIWMMGDTSTTAKLVSLNAFDSTYAVSLGTNNISRLFIDPSGAVGINTSAPNIAAATPSTGILTINGSGTGITDTGTIELSNPIASVSSSTYGGKLTFNAQNNSTNKTLGSISMATIGTSGSAGFGSAIFFETKNNIGSSNMMVYNNLGYLGIGGGSAAAPAYTIHVNGTAGLSSGTAWTAASDIRLKDIQGDYEYGLDEILKLHTVRFNYKKGNALNLPSQTPMTGFIAQEVQKVIPDAVHTRPDGYLELNVDPIHWATVNAVQELHGICKATEAQLTSIERRIASIEDDSKAKDLRIQKLEEENAALKKDLEMIKAKLGL
jgi:hypothetical protein